MRPDGIRDSYDYEGELAVDHRAVPPGTFAPADAFDHVAGYSCFLDGSVRDYQYRTSQFTAGKNFYRSGAFGPVAGHRRFEIDDAQSSWSLQTRVSGEVMQDGNTRDMVFGIGETDRVPVRQSSRWNRATSSRPARRSGVGRRRGSPPRWLVPGEVVEVEIDGIGILRNEVVAE